ncbi:MAG: geranyl transferase, partial [Gammaproteobacteria bacterium]
MKTSFQTFMQECQQRTESALDQWLPSDQQEPANLHKAMRYSVMNGGKRVRPMLVHATGMVFDAYRDALDGPACAVEMIHVYSLIHDDLPAMDDDDLRRGQPTCHKAFDDATAILAGDALQALAFQVLAQDQNMTVNDTARLKMIETLTIASGSVGMAGGQAIDLAAEGKSQSLTELENMHALKTGALIRASIRLGALTHPDISDHELEILDHYGQCIGLAFQIQDDIL